VVVRSSAGVVPAEVRATMGVDMQGMDERVRRQCREYDNLCTAIDRMIGQGAESDRHHKVHDLIARRDRLHERITGALYAA